MALDADWPDVAEWNLPRDPEDRAELRGLDVYSLSQSAAEVVAYLDRVDPAGAAEARRRYGCLTPFFEDPARYGAAARLGAADCEDAVVAQLASMVQKRFAYSAQDGHDYLDAEQNARVVTAAETYFRAMYRSSVESWNRRDGHMFATLLRLLEARGANSKAVVWAHNSHIGDASATAMGGTGEFNIGQLCREAFGPRCVSMGFGTDRGTVMAADDWGSEPRIKAVLPSRPDSLEHLFQVAGRPRSLTTWRGDPELAEAAEPGQSSAASVGRRLCGFCAWRRERANAARGAILGALFAQDFHHQGAFDRVNLGKQQTFEALDVLVMDEVGDHGRLLAGSRRVWPPPE